MERILNVAAKGHEVSAVKKKKKVAGWKLRPDVKSETRKNWCSGGASTRRQSPKMEEEVLEKYDVEEAKTVRTKSVVSRKKSSKKRKDIGLEMARRLLGDNFFMVQRIQLAAEQVCRQLTRKRRD